MKLLFFNFFFYLCIERIITNKVIKRHRDQLWNNIYLPNPATVALHRLPQQYEFLEDIKDLHTSIRNKTHTPRANQDLLNFHNSQVNFRIIFLISCRKCLSFNLCSILENYG
jgi:hypothetical protein